MKYFLLLISLSGSLWAAPPVVDDLGLAKTLQQKLGTLAEQKSASTGESLAAALKNAPKSKQVTPLKAQPAADYESLTKCVYMLGSVYKCGKCEHWHSAGSATAWCVSSDGLMITNYHVFKNAKGEAWGVCGFNGEVYPVKEILAGNEADDVALFRVEAKDLAALPIGPDAPVGSNIRILSHPAGRCFVETFGRISRYFRQAQPNNQPGPVMMAVTADYAKGSSGGPVVNDEGSVVGMVSSTQTITYGDKSGKKEEGPVQMVMKNCVSGAALRTLVSSVETPATAR